MSTGPSSTPRDGDPIAAPDVARALMAGELIYEDGSTQVFLADGSTTFVEHGRPTPGEWYLDEDGRFCSFWPPSYRACYDLSWVVERGEFAGVRFQEREGGSVSVGRYRS